MPDYDDFVTLIVHTDELDVWTGTGCEDVAAARKDKERLSAATKHECDLRRPEAEGV